MGPTGINILVFIYSFIRNAYLKIDKSTTAHERGMRKGYTTYVNMHFNKYRLLPILTYLIKIVHYNFNSIINKVHQSHQRIYSLSCGGNPHSKCSVARFLSKCFLSSGTNCLDNFNKENYHSFLVFIHAFIHV